MARMNYTRARKSSGVVRLSSGGDAADRWLAKALGAWDKPRSGKTSNKRAQAARIAAAGGIDHAKKSKFNPNKQPVLPSKSWFVPEDNALVVQIGKNIASHSHWPASDIWKWKYIAKRRKLVRESVLNACRAEGMRYDAERGVIAGLKDSIAILGFVRFCPQSQFIKDSDNLIAFKPFIDGAYDAVYGFTMMSNGKPRWVGHLSDDDLDVNAAFRRQYNQVDSDLCGLQVIVKLKVQ